jgi:predicted methyltransferase
MFHSKIKRPQTSIVKYSLLAAFFSLTTANVSAADKGLEMTLSDTKLEKIISSDHRSANNVIRDQFRNPQRTLEFFGIKDTMTVVELTPGSGYYTEILAPYLKDKGEYIAAGFDPEAEHEYYRKNAKRFDEKLKAAPELYGKVKVSILQPPKKLKFAEPETVDLVLSFRNTHSWANANALEEVFAEVHKALKFGGTFGLVQHRAGHLHPKDSSGKKGYLKQSKIIKVAEKMGFHLLEKSNINANEKDTRDYENGVWTLPPSLALKDKDSEKYKAIGESDRMTLKFVKPHLK